MIEICKNLKVGTVLKETKLCTDGCNCVMSVFNFRGLYRDVCN